MSAPGNGLRTAGGSLAGGLDALYYSDGAADYRAGRAPPRITSASYDLGRQKAAELRAADQAERRRPKKYRPD